MRERARQRVEELQDQITSRLEEFDGRAHFVETHWTRAEGGGGRTRLMSDGQVFEKAGVNVSAVFGEVPESLRGSMGGTGNEFYATGISLVLHPVNPHVPTTHANFRYVERGDDAWFGGGADLTPYILYEEDARHFHRALQAPCDRYDTTYYPRFKRWCDDYFYLPHREEARGVGGIFFDHVMADETHGLEALFSWWSDAGAAFLDAYGPIVARRADIPYSERQRTWQLQRRGRYVEFNLIYDRGTSFGLKTGGRVESILMSMPPLVRWDGMLEPEPGSPEARLLEVFRQPRGWI